MEVAGAHVDRQLIGRAEDRFGFKAVDLRADVVVDRGPGNNTAQLETLIVIVEAGQIEDDLAVGERVLRTDFIGIDEFRIERIRNREDRRQRRIDPARLVAARVGHVDQVIVSDLPVEHSTSGEFAELDRAGLVSFATCDRTERAKRWTGRAGSERIGIEPGAIDAVRFVGIGRAERNQIAGQGRPGAERFLVVVVTTAQGQLQLVVELKVDFTKDPVGIDLQIVRIAAERRGREITRRQTATKRGEGSKDARKVVDPERSHIVAVFGQVEPADNPAEQEVDLPIKIRRNDCFGVPARLVGVGTVKVLRGLRAKPLAGECTSAGFFSQ